MCSRSCSTALLTLRPHALLCNTDAYIVPPTQCTTLLPASGSRAHQAKCAPDSGAGTERPVPHAHGGRLQHQALPCRAGRRAGRPRPAGARWGAPGARGRVRASAVRRPLRSRRRRRGAALRACRRMLRPCIRSWSAAGAHPVGLVAARRSLRAGRGRACRVALRRVVRGVRAGPRRRRLRRSHVLELLVAVDVNALRGRAGASVAAWARQGGGRRQRAGLARARLRALPEPSASAASLEGAGRKSVSRTPLEDGRAFFFGRSSCGARVVAGGQGADCGCKHCQCPEACVPHRRCLSGPWSAGGRRRAAWRAAWERARRQTVAQHRWWMAAAAPTAGRAALPCDRALRLRGSTR